MAVGAAPGLTSDLLPAYELEGGQQLAGALVAPADREPGQTRGGAKGGLAHTAAHELIGTLHNKCEIKAHI